MGGHRIGDKEAIQPADGNIVVKKAFFVWARVELIYYPKSPFIRSGLTHLFEKSDKLREQKPYAYLNNKALYKRVSVYCKGLF